MQTVSVTRTTGQTIYAYPDLSEGFSLADWTTHRVQLTESTAPNLGIYTAQLDETKATLWRYFIGASQPSDWDQSKGYFDLSTAVSLDTLLDRTDAGAVVFSNNPVAQDGSLTEIIIGDDYLAANGRALQWTIAEPSGLTAANCVCKFGLKTVTGSKVITGTVTDLGSTWRLSVDIAHNDWDGLTEGLAEYSVEVHQGTGNGTDITVVINELCGGVILREKQT